MVLTHIDILRDTILQEYARTDKLNDAKMEIQIVTFAQPPQLNNRIASFLVH